MADISFKNHSLNSNNEDIAQPKMSQRAFNFA